MSCQVVHSGRTPHHTATQMRWGVNNERAPLSRLLTAGRVALFSGLMSLSHVADSVLWTLLLRCSINQAAETCWVTWVVQNTKTSNFNLRRIAELLLDPLRITSPVVTPSPFARPNAQTPSIVFLFEWAVPFLHTQHHVSITIFFFFPALTTGSYIDNDWRVVLTYRGKIVAS